MGWCRHVARISRRPQRRCALHLESLEERVALSTFLVSNLNDGGDGSLRQAIAQADGTPGPNEIDFAAGLAGTILLTSGQLTIANNDLTVAGPGADQLGVSGTGTSRVFEVDAVSATITGLAIADGSAPATNNAGGGVYNNGGTLTLAGCVVRDNAAGAGGGLYNNNATLIIADSTISDNAAAYGGGIYNSSFNQASSVTIAGSTFSGNAATTAGGGLDNNNGGMANNNGGTVAIADSTFRGNTTSGTGAGLHSYGGVVAVAGSTFSGNAAGVDGGGLYCIGKVGSQVTISGSSVSGNTATDGAGLSNNGGTMTILDSTVADNAASGTGDAGGGIDNYTNSTLTILRSTISGNSVGVYGAGIDNIDGATATIADSTIRANHADGDGVHAPLGGGIYSYNATLILANTSLSNNAAAYGGGLYNNSFNGASTATITDSTVVGNTALQGGGGVDNNNGATLTIAGSTFSGNAAGNGGGLHNFNGSVLVAGSTFSGNAAGNGGGLANTSGAFSITDSTIAGNSANNAGGVFDGSAGFQMRNTIVAGNLAGTFADLDGRLRSSGYNLVETPVGGSGFDPTDLLGVDPLLGPLQDNGGPTPTMALLPNSPALDAGDPAQGGVPDQRGVARTGGVNIGAYQASATAFLVSAPAKVTAGVPFAMTVTAVDPFGQVAVGYTGMVSFRTTDPDPGVILPADYSFTTSDAGVHLFTDTGPGETTLITRGYQAVVVTDTADDTLTGSTTVKVRHARHHPDGSPDLVAALAVATGDRFAGPYFCCSTDERSLFVENGDVLR